MEQLQVSTALWILLCMSGVYRYSSAALITPCADNNACTEAGGDANSECDTANGDGVCVCKSTHKVDGSGTCVTKGLTDQCGSDGDCVAVTHAVCTEGKCECGSAYKKATETCVAKEHGDPCTANADCTGQSQECSDGSSKVCTCLSTHSYDGKNCVQLVGHADECNVGADCTGLNLKCDTSKDPDVCTCKDGYSQDGAHCIKGHGDACAADADCTGQNLECDDSNPKACACKAGYSKDGVDCVKVPDNSADVIGMAIPVVIFLLSIALLDKLG